MDRQSEKQQLMGQIKDLTQRLQTALAQRDELQKRLAHSGHTSADIASPPPPLSPSGPVPTARPPMPAVTDDDKVFTTVCIDSFFFYTLTYGWILLRNVNRDRCLRFDPNRSPRQPNRRQRLTLTAMMKATVRRVTPVPANRAKRAPHCVRAWTS